MVLSFVYLVALLRLLFAAAGASTSRTLSCSCCAIKWTFCVVRSSARLYDRVTARCLPAQLGCCRRRAAAACSSRRRRCCGGTDSSSGGDGPTRV
jgi:hypothetical protein